MQESNIMQEVEKSLDLTSVIVKKSSLGGRGIFAKKCIKRGSLLFTNDPLVIGPRADCGTEKFCSNCFKISDQCYRCDKCFLFICSKICEISQSHNQLCVFIGNNWKSNVKFDANTMAVLIYIKCLLLTEQQRKFIEIFQRDETENKLRELDILCSQFVLPDEHIEFLKMVNLILKINSFRITHTSTEKKVQLRGLFPLSSFLNHSCIPNTRNKFKNNYSMEVYASKDIEEEEELTTCYTSLLCCSPVRRWQLYKTKGFWCACLRCSDKTEMDTKLSALKCLNVSCTGIVLPKVPLNQNTMWVCQDCGLLMTPQKIGFIQSILGSLVGTLDLNNNFKLETPALKRLAIFIPPSNHILVEIQLNMALYLGFADKCGFTDLSESQLSLKEKLCRDTLRTLAALDVGDAHLRGLLLYHLHAALAERARRYPDLYEELRSEIESTIEHACSILQDDISAPPDLELRRQYLGPGCDKPHEERFVILDAPDNFNNVV